MENGNVSECVFSEGRNCKALKDKICEDCVFRKTESELGRGRERAKERIFNMPPGERKNELVRRYLGV